MDTISEGHSVSKVQRIPPPNYPHINYSQSSNSIPTNMQLYQNHVPLPESNLNTYHHPMRSSTIINHNAVNVKINVEPPITKGLQDITSDNVITPVEDLEPKIIKLGEEQKTMHNVLVSMKMKEMGISSQDIFNTFNERESIPQKRTLFNDISTETVSMDSSSMMSESELERIQLFKQQTMERNDNK